MRTRRAVDGRHRIHLALDRDGFAEQKPVCFDENLQRLTFVLESREPQPAKPHTIELTVSSLPAAYEVAAGGKSVSRIPAEGGIVPLPIAEQGTTVNLVRVRWGGGGAGGTFRKSPFSPACISISSSRRVRKLAKCSLSDAQSDRARAGHVLKQHPAIRRLEKLPMYRNRSLRVATAAILLFSIVAGNLTIHEFDVAGSMHYVVDFGDVGQWDGNLAAQKLRLIAEEHRRLLGSLPFKRYLFLNAFRPGAGGLEHLNSTLLTSAPARSDVPTLPWLKFVSHEYFHAINVKRLRPIELGPFDYENPPKTASLWISEGLTSYYGDLAVTRSGVGSAQDFLLGMSAQIRRLQNSPGRLVQTLEQSSRDVWTSSYSGVGGNNKTTVSYYVKGLIVGFLLDAKIRHVTNDTRSLDDVMRLAFGRYSGSRGFKPDEFQAVAAEVAGVELDGFFGRALASTEELDYSEMLEWFGLRFAPQSDPPDPAKTWMLEARPDATDAQKRHLQRLFAPGVPPRSATSGSQPQPQIAHEPMAHHLLDCNCWKKSLRGETGELSALNRFSQLQTAENEE